VKNLKMPLIAFRYGMVVISLNYGSDAWKLARISSHRMLLMEILFS
jgi:hypothetical protein